MYRVLIVEDDPMVAMINEQYIRRNKKFCVVGKCGDGKSALEFLESNQVDLIVLDVFMPQTDGFDTLRQIRKKKIDTEAIMVTAANDRSSLEEALHLGVVDYLVKPFTFERFQMALDKFVAHNDVLNGLDTLNQQSIDFVIDNSRKSGEKLHPKGIGEKTLAMLVEHMKSHSGLWLNGEEIAEKTGLTSVTVRRYMNYLAEKGSVLAEMNYETGGRPCMMYKIIT